MWKEFFCIVRVLDNDLSFCFFRAKVKLLLWIGWNWIIWVFFTDFLHSNCTPSVYVWEWSFKCVACVTTMSDTSYIENAKNHIQTRSTFALFHIKLLLESLQACSNTISNELPFHLSLVHNIRTSLDLSHLDITSKSLRFILCQTSG